MADIPDDLKDLMDRYNFSFDDLISFQMKFNRMADRQIPFVEIYEELWSTIDGKMNKVCLYMALIYASINREEVRDLEKVIDKLEENYDKGEKIH